jgi:esterase/lipase superfamily enzyme
VAEGVRAKQAANRLALQYGDERGDLELGKCRVSIPIRHQLGHMERPNLWLGEFLEKPRKHIVVLSIESRSEERFHAELRDKVAASEKREAFVFVHGYNVEFDEAARRAAQIAYDVKFDGAPVIYSWPSGGDYEDYVSDRGTIRRSARHLKNFLTKLRARSGAARVHIVAHSMGNEVLGEAFLRMPRGRKLFHEIVSAAPDVDAEDFRAEIGPAMVELGDRVTLYVSDDDSALRASKGLHGGQPRAGQAGETIIVMPLIDTIDVTGVAPGHSYIFEDEAVRSDLVALIREHAAADRRPSLDPAPDGRGYWILKGD